MSITQDQLAERLQKRAEERQAKKESTKDDEKISVHEQDNTFSKDFTVTHQKILGLLDQCPALNKSLLSQHFDAISKNIQQLQKFLSDSSPYLSSYKVRKSQQDLAELQKEMQAAQDKFTPKRKFAFKSKKNEAPSKPQDLIDGGSAIKKKEPVLQKTHQTKADIFFDCGFQNLNGQNLEMSAEETKEKDVSVSKLTDCKVAIYGFPSTVHLSHLSNCTVLTGPVGTSVFIESCEGCTFVVACQQLRVHMSVRCSFYLHVVSEPIVEDSKELGFAPYNWQYPELKAHIQLSGLNWTQNNWSLVKDFNWLSASEPSPNWKVIDPKDRVLLWEDSTQQS